MKDTTDQKNGFTLVEVMVVLILLTLSFMVFLRALNTGETIRARSEIRTTQSVILNSLENEIRARRFDENASYPWSSTLGKDTGESQLIQFDDIDDFDGYYIFFSVLSSTNLPNLILFLRPLSSDHYPLFRSLPNNFLSHPGPYIVSPSSISSSRILSAF